MPLIYNPLSKRVAVQIAGNWFDFAPGQVKLIHNDSIAHIMCTTKQDEGLVAVPDIVGEDKSSPEAKKALEEARKVGINNRIRALKLVVHNLEVSLRRDLEMKGIKGVGVEAFASEGEMAAYRELAAYHDEKRNEEKAKVEELQRLREKVSKEA